MIYWTRILGSVLFIGACALPSTAIAQVQPNIVLIFADDLGWSDTSNSLTNMGNPSDFYETPALETLAAEGMAFTNAYTNGPNCAPTRSALLTGQYAPRPTNNIYLVDNLNRVGGANTLLIGPPQGLPDGQDAIPGSAITVAETLKTAGYVTAYVGKFHTTDNANSITAEHGFDFNFGGNSNGGPGNYHANNGVFGSRIGSALDSFADDYTQEYVDANIKPFAGSGTTVQSIDALVGTRKHVTDASTDAAISFLGSEATKPMFLMLSHYAVHTPVGDSQARLDLLEKYRGKAKGQVDTDESFGALIEGLDQSIARIVDYLKKTDDPRNPGQKLDKNTILIFYSDNGGRQNQSNNGPLRGQKGELSEGGIRVPMIAWSGSSALVAGGVVMDVPVTSIDLYQTFRAMGNAAAPANYILDGEDLSALFLNQGEARSQLLERPIYWHLPGYLLESGRNQRPQSIVRQGTLKLIYNYETASYELYDLDTDISEGSNQLEAPLDGLTADRATAMAALLNNWLVDTNAPLPTLRSTGETVALPHGNLVTGPITFRLGREGGQDLAGQTAAIMSYGELDLSLQAIGQDAVFATNNSGVGVDSLSDSGSTQEQRRVDGADGIEEELRVSFSCRVRLSSITTGGISVNGQESFRVRLVSGTNPFTNLSGYDDGGFSKPDDQTLAFAPSDGQATPLRVSYEGDNRSSLIVEANTVLGLSANPSVSGGILFNEIQVDSLCDDGGSGSDAGIDGGSADTQIDMGIDAADADSGGGLVDADAGVNADGGSNNDTGVGPGADTGSRPLPILPDSGCGATGSPGSTGLWLLVVVLGLTYVARRNFMFQK